MAKHSRMLHFATGNGTDDVTLYTTLGEVVDPALINEDQTTGGISLYTTGSDTGYPALRVQDGGTTVYAPLVDPASMSATNLKVQHNGTNYAVGNATDMPVGICLVQSGGGAGTWAWVDGDGVYRNNIDFNTIYPWSDIQAVTIDGQAMVKIPKYYVKNTTLSSGGLAGKKVRMVSKTKLPGYHIHPAFVKNGYVMDCFYVARYRAYDAGNNQVGSKAGKTMLRLQSDIAKNRIANLGTTWHMFNIYETAAIDNLILIELGTPDVQSAIAPGATAEYATGASAGKWRGVDDYWGGGYGNGHGEFVDGYYKGHILSNKMDGTYVEITPNWTSGAGWIISMREDTGTNYDLSDVFIPATGSTDYNSGTYDDYYVTRDMGEHIWIRNTGEPSNSNGKYRGLFAFNGLEFTPSPSYGQYSQQFSWTFRLAKEGNMTNEIA